MKYTIDRFEENLAICETENQEWLSIPICKIPRQAKEGDILVEDHGNYLLDTQETEQRRERIRKKMLDLFE